MNVNNQINFQQHLHNATALISQGKEMAFVEIELRQNLADEQMVSDVLKELNRLRNAKRTKAGSFIVLCAVLILGISCISCIFIHIMGGNINIALYGLTSVGLVTLIVGLVLIFS